MIIMKKKTAFRLTRSGLKTKIVGQSPKVNYFEFENTQIEIIKLFRMGVPKAYKIYVKLIIFLDILMK